MVPTRVTWVTCKPKSVTWILPVRSYLPPLLLSSPIFLPPTFFLQPFYLRCACIPVSFPPPWSDERATGPGVARGKRFAEGGGQIPGRWPLTYDRCTNWCIHVHRHLTPGPGNFLSVFLWMKERLWSFSVPAHCRPFHCSKLNLWPCGFQQELSGPQLYNVLISELLILQLFLVAFCWKKRRICAVWSYDPLFCFGDSTKLWSRCEHDLLTLRSQHVLCSVFYDLGQTDKLIYHFNSWIIWVGWLKW